MWASVVTAVAKFFSAAFSYVGLIFAWIAGYRRAKNKAMGEALDHAKKAAEIDERVDHLSDDERRKWLYGDPKN